MKKTKVPFLTYALINIFVLTLIIDLTSIIYNNYIINLIVGAITCFIANTIVVKKLEFVSRFERQDLLFFVILLGLFVVTIVYPDRSYDSFNYHIYLQENSFSTRINYDFFPASEIQTFTYAFADRSFYIFRYIFGYRLGLLFNYLILSIIFYESKDIIRELIRTKKDGFISFLAILAVFTLSIVDIVDSYYIDLISLACLLLLFKVILYRDISSNNSLYYLFMSLMFGFTFILKISNGFFLIAFFIMFIVRNNKKILSTINIKNILIMIGGLTITIAPYVIYTWVSTGNPVFPFYNTIFKSEYYPLSNWMDYKFGPKTIKQLFGWPLFIMSYPSFACDIEIVEPIWCIGWIASLIYISCSLFRYIVKKDYDKKYLVFALVHIILVFIWAKFTLGYTRYGLITLVLSIISTIVFAYKLCINKKYILLGILSLFLIYNYAYVFNNFFYGNKEWIYHNYFSYPEKKEDYDYNLNQLFARGYDIELENDSVWGVVYSNSGLMTLMNDRIPIINISKGGSTNKDIEIKNSLLEKASHIYTAVDSIDFNNFFDSLEKTDYGINNVKYVLHYDLITNKNQFVYVFELSKKSNNKHYVLMNSKYELNLKDDDMRDFYIGIPKDSAYVFDNDFDISINNKGYTISKDGNMVYLEMNKDKVDIVNDNTTSGWLMIIY